MTDLAPRWHGGRAIQRREVRRIFQANVVINSDSSTPPKRSASAFKRWSSDHLAGLNVRSLHRRRFYARLLIAFNNRLALTLQQLLQIFSTSWLEVNSSPHCSLNWLRLFALPAKPAHAASNSECETAAVLFLAQCHALFAGVRHAIGKEAMRASSS